MRVTQTDLKLQYFLAKEQVHVKKRMWKEGYNLLNSLRLNNMPDESLPSSKDTTSSKQHSLFLIWTWSWLSQSEGEI